MASWDDVVSQSTMSRIHAAIERMAAHYQMEQVCPRADWVFRAFVETPPDAVRCVIIGQDPYPQPGVAQGLAFSDPRSLDLVQPSLQNILAEWSADTGLPLPGTGDLLPWAHNGVLLVNTFLTVAAGVPNSHAYIWDGVVWSILSDLVAYERHPICFVGWGSKAISVIAAVRQSLPSADQSLVLAVTSTHPSPLSWDRPSRTARAFKGSRPFSHVNGLLAANGVAPIDWRL